MSYATLETVGNIGIVRLERPERLNAISAPLIRDLGVALDAATADPALAALVLCGAGRAFCAGNDLKDVGRYAGDAVAARAFVDAIQHVSRTLMASDKFVVAAAQGYAVGGGFELLLNCDFVVAADDLVAYFPEMALGQYVTGGVTCLLPRALGRQQALELLVLGERQDSAALARRGLAQRVVPGAQLMTVALDVARAAAAKSCTSVARLKRALYAALAPEFERALEAETQATVEALSRADALGRVPERFMAES